MIKLVDVWFRYSDRKEWVLKGISTSFKPRETNIIMGANGSGKTTLLKIAALLYKPCKGKVFVNDKSFWELDKNKRLLLRRKVVYVHEKPILLRGLVIYNIAYGLILRGVKVDKAMWKAEELLNEIGMGYLANRDSKSLSAGEAQLVTIIRALILEPEIAFLDEPFAHLDRQKRKKLTELLESFKSRGTGFVITTHNDTILKDLSIDRVFVLENGMLIEESLNNCQF